MWWHTGAPQAPGCLASFPGVHLVGDGVPSGCRVAVGVERAVVVGLVVEVRSLEVVVGVVVEVAVRIVVEVVVGFERAGLLCAHLVALSNSFPPCGSDDDSTYTP